MNISSSKLQNAPLKKTRTQKENSENHRPHLNTIRSNKDKTIIWFHIIWPPHIQCKLCGDIGTSIREQGCAQCEAGAGWFFPLTSTLIPPHLPAACQHEDTSGTCRMDSVSSGWCRSCSPGSQRTRTACCSEPFFWKNPADVEEEQGSTWPGQVLVYLDNCFTSSLPVLATCQSQKPKPSEEKQSAGTLQLSQVSSP